MRAVIAIVDDDILVRRALKRLVRSRGMDAEIFGSGEDFIEVLELTPSFKPHCVILDVQLPGLNGFQVQERLARICPDTPVIFVTAAGKAHIREQAIASSAAGFFYKPLDEDVLIATLHSILGIKGDEEP